MLVREAGLALRVAIPIWMFIQTQTGWIGSASAAGVLEQGTMDETRTADHPQPGASGDHYRDEARRRKHAVREMREARRERMFERRRDARHRERRRNLRREGLRLSFLTEAERRALRLEGRKFRRQPGLGRTHDASLAHGTPGPLGPFEFSPDERRILRNRVQRLPTQEREELRSKIRNMRELPEAERELLRERLREMNTLAGDEQRAFREKARRWARMSDVRREELRVAMRRLRALPADERLELLERVLAGSESELDGPVDLDSGPSR